MSYLDAIAAEAIDTLENGVLRSAFRGTLNDNFTKVGERLERIVYDAVAYGVVADGATDDAPAINALIASVKAALDVGNLGDSPLIKLPAGEIVLDTPIKLYSGVAIEGQGISTKITKGASFSGLALVELTGGSAYYCQDAILDKLAFFGDCLAIADKPIVGQTLTVLNCTFSNLYFETTDACVLTQYIQNCVFDGWLSRGLLNRLIHFAGNFNFFRRIEKAGGTGSTTAPYVKCTRDYAGYRSTGNTFEALLIQGGGSPNKTPVILVGAETTTLRDCWVELTPYPSGNVTNGFAIELDDCGSVRFDGSLSLQVPNYDRHIKVTDTADLQIEHLSITQDDVSIYDTFTLSASLVTINTFVTRSNSGALRIDTATTLRVGETILTDIVTNATAGAIRSVKTSYTGGNFLRNPSFENGTDGWTIGGSGVVTTTLVNSGATLGKALSAVVSPINTAFTVYQNVAFLTEHIGHPFTFTALVKTAESGGYIKPLIYGAGVDVYTTQYNVARYGAWTLISQTFTPVSAGTAQVGVWCQDLTTALLDAFSLTPGTLGQMDASTFGSIEVGSRSISNASAIPTSGTWRVGDLIINNAPSSGESPFWVCTVASASSSDPGTWIGAAKLSATDYLLASTAASTYLPLAGGTLVGGLTGTTATLTQLINVAESAASSKTHIKLRGGTTGFSGTNDTDLEQVIESDGCAYDGGSILQVAIGQIAFKKNGSFNTGAGDPIKGKTVLRAQGGTVSTPVMVDSLTAEPDKVTAHKPVVVPTYTVAGLPAASVGTGATVFVSNESGGATIAFSDGTNWRRVADRAIVS